MKCPHCRSANIIRKGRRKTKLGFRQLFYCRDCQRGFGDSKLLHKTYGPRVINSAISYYNLGNTLERSARLTNRRFKVRVSKSSVSQWLKEFRGICTYHRIRPAAVKDYGGRILVSKTFEHSGLAYHFKYHKPKPELLCKDQGFSSLMGYLKRFERGCPKFFDDVENRCSQVRIAVRFSKKTRYNNACQLADFALKACAFNSQRHAAVEEFMLINDSSTIACEVPVWLWEKNLNLGIAGHIDLLQIRRGKIFVLDFKPGAQREDEQKVASQLFWYAEGLSFRTSIPLKDFACGWFDDRVYYEFVPAEAKIKFPKAANFASRVSNGFGKERGIG